MNTMDDKIQLMSIRKNVQPIDITFQNITYTVNTGTFKSEPKTILKGVSGTFKSGELTAIMGPSGAGKSTLLNILTGFYKDGISGSIKTTDQPLNKRNSINGLRKKDSCYILQDDQLCPLFTVQETMVIAANLKLGSSLVKKSKLMLIEDILDSIGLLKAKDTRCARLSGGQKKRLSIALELIDNPPLMFLDEPTTGLDSSSCTQSVSIMRSLARGGRTIVCTIHQPSASVFEMFDHVYVVSDGLCVYQGSCLNIIPYLQTIGLHCPQYHNPADFILEVVNGEYGHFSSQLTAIANDPCWRGSSPQKQSNLINLDEINNKRNYLANGTNGTTKFQHKITSPSEFYRFFILLRKCLVKMYRDWTISHLKIVMHTIVGIFIGLLYSSCGVDASKSISNISFLIVSLVYLSYTSLMPAILKFPSELKVIKKEQFNNWYKLETYYAAFIVVNVPIQMLISLLYSLFAYYLSSQILVFWRFSIFLTVGILVSVLSEGLGLWLGTSCDHPVNGVFFGAILICFFILFAGYVALFNHMPTILYYVTYTSYLRYGFESMVVSVYGFERPPLDCPFDEHNYCHFRFPQTLFQELGMTEKRLVPNLIMLCFFVVAFFTLAYVGLRRRVRRNT